MPSIFICGAGPKIASILDWLATRCTISRDEVTAIVPHPYPDTDSEAYGVPVIPFGQFIAQVGANDIVIVISEDFVGAVGALLARGCRTIIDGAGALQSTSPVQRLLDATAHFQVGAGPLPTDVQEDDEFRRYTADPVSPDQLPDHSLFVVNSMPKSGTVWMAAMLEDVLGLETGRRIIVCHVRDIESEWPKRNRHGAVALVRDMRDVVVSWFHQLRRFDLQNGFVAPRYPDVESFYFQYFIGQLFGRPRYYGGRFVHWLDYIGARNIPLVRYEDMVRDPFAALRKVMTFWKIAVPDAVVRDVVERYRFDRMDEAVSSGTGYVADMLCTGHLRRGRPGAWADELPPPIADDVCNRFADYQHRLRYDWKSQSVAARRAR
jgi:hypothetical protein